jgi:protoporphyrin/coproporphyrin ferrochelatase
MHNRAVLLLAHGTPETIDQIPEYLRNVVSGRPVPPHVVEEIQHRYSLIGRSPLTELTLEQARLVETELVKSGPSVRVYVGMRNWRPYISDVVKQMRADGVDEAAVICMAPQNSRTSVGLYRRAVHAEAGALRIDFTESWARHPLLADALAERLQPAWTRLSREAGHPVPVLFTAHSVPTRTVEAPASPEAAGQAKEPRLWPGEGPTPSAPDSYAEEARHTAELVAARVPEIPSWTFAFQSQGASGGPWIGPTVEETLDRLAGEGVTALILHPIGFLCDHVEILYDVDIHFRDYAAGRGILLARPESLNGSTTLARAVADLARQGLARLRQ